jgi:hypothetical protein
VVAVEPVAAVSSVAIVAVVSGGVSDTTVSAGIVAVTTVVSVSVMAVSDVASSFLQERPAIKTRPISILRINAFC